MTGSDGAVILMILLIIAATILAGPTVWRNFKATHSKK